MSGFWRIWFAMFCLALVIFGAVLSAGAIEATSGPANVMLTLLGGNPVPPFSPAFRFALGVLGAVSIGWALAMHFVIDAAIALGDRGRPLWHAMTKGIVCWFVIDSGLTIATGFGWNVVPNCLLASMYLVGLLGSGVLRTTSQDVNAARGDPQVRGSAVPRS